jgi:hypothetical protein
MVSDALKPIQRPRTSFLSRPTIGLETPSRTPDDTAMASSPATLSPMPWNTVSIQVAAAAADGSANRVLERDRQDVWHDALKATKVLPVPAPFSRLYRERALLSVSTQPWQGCCLYLFFCCHPLSIPLSNGESPALPTGSVYETAPVETSWHACNHSCTSLQVPVTGGRKVISGSMCRPRSRLHLRCKQLCPSFTCTAPPGSQPLPWMSSTTSPLSTPHTSHVLMLSNCAPSLPRRSRAASLLQRPACKPLLGAAAVA